RRFAADYRRRSASRAPASRSFNEAAAIRRGLPSAPSGVGLPFSGFNEAAAIRRGLRRHRLSHQNGGKASMRPRRFAADYAIATLLNPTAVNASMRPRRFAADYPASHAMPRPSMLALQ